MFFEEIYGIVNVIEFIGNVYLIKSVFFRNIIKWKIEIIWIIKIFF